jgi:tRNA (mo5U34)-methyltransferase
MDATFKSTEVRPTEERGGCYPRLGFADFWEPSVSKIAKFEELFKGIYWHQKWEIEPGIFTPGHNDVGFLLKVGGLPANLTGKRILDIGSWNGCVSFECERRGATDILAIGPEDPENTGFNRLRAYLRSNVRYEYGTIYHLDPSKVGTFDIIICFGVLYHLRYPLLGLDMMRRVAKGSLLVESSCIERDIRLPQGKQTTLQALNKQLSNIPFLQFYRKGELNGDDSNWFSFNQIALTEMLRSSGFEPSSTELVNDRIVVNSNVIPGQPEWLTMKTGEGVYYDVITRPVLGDRDVY